MQSLLTSPVLLYCGRHPLLTSSLMPPSTLSSLSLSCTFPLISSSAPLLKLIRLVHLIILLSLLLLLLLLLLPHYQGGVWWGDDGTLNDAVSKGTIADDALFREAEKHGIDIRKKRVEESALAAQVRVRQLMNETTVE